MRHLFILFIILTSCTQESPSDRLKQAVEYHTNRKVMEAEFRIKSVNYPNDVSENVDYILHHKFTDSELKQTQYVTEAFLDSFWVYGDHIFIHDKNGKVINFYQYE